VRLVSWNVAGRTNRLPERIAAIEDLQADVLALQEVTRRSLGAYRRDLPDLGLTHILDSFRLAPEPQLLQGPRRYGELIASRSALTPLDPSAFDVPWPERILSALLHTKGGDVELHTTHVPVGVSHGWIKIEHFEGLSAALACESMRPRILCGDFNSPKAESADGR
jgi:endonuclease/exonuclease/phosphatase family metal-dependent hydrolase